MAAVRKVMFIVGVTILFNIAVFAAMLSVASIIANDLGDFVVHELEHRLMTEDFTKFVENMNSYQETATNKYEPPVWMYLLLIALHGAAFVIAGFALEKKGLGYYVLLPVYMYIAWSSTGNLFTKNSDTTVLLIALYAMVNICSFYLGRRLVNRYVWHPFCAFV